MLLAGTWNSSTRRCLQERYTYIAVPFCSVWALPNRPWRHPYSTCKLHIKGQESNIALVLGRQAMAQTLVMAQKRHRKPKHVVKVHCVQLPHFDLIPAWDETHGRLLLQLGLLAVVGYVACLSYAEYKQRFC
jgi:hypothetical protein